MVKSEDCMVWKGDSQGRFSVKSAYRDFNRSNKQVECLPWKLIWKVKIRSKINCFVWIMDKGSVLTQDNLVSRISQLCSRCIYVESK